jgi:hypothetical protein
VEAKHRQNLQEKLHLQDQEEILPHPTHPREVIPQDRSNNRHWQGGDQVRHRWREEFIQVNHESRYVKWSISNTFHLIVASEGSSQGRMKRRRHKICCIHQDHESTPAYEDKKDD